MKLTYCWTEPSGYLAACIAALANRPEVDVTLLTWEPVSDAPFSAKTLGVANARVLGRSERNDPRLVEELVVASQPDVVFFSGWAHPPYVALTRSRRLSGTRFIMGADTQIRFDWRQRLARVRIGRLLRRLDAILVAGERGHQLMRYWGVPARKVARFLYGIDYGLFAGPAERRFATGLAWPKRFVFAGRYVQSKGLNVLVEAYRRYRREVAAPWPLTTCGTGPLSVDLCREEGIHDAGFLQPPALADVLQEAGVFLLPSLVEPWGQVIVEAAASGLPVICSQACGAAADVVRDFHNGFVVPCGDTEGLFRAMRWVHQHVERLPQMGRNGQVLAAAFSADRWAENQVALAQRLLDA